MGDIREMAVLNLVVIEAKQAYCAIKRCASRQSNKPSLHPKTRHQMELKLQIGYVGKYLIPSTTLAS